MEHKFKFLTVEIGLSFRQWFLAALQYPWNFLTSQDPDFRVAWKVLNLICGEQNFTKMSKIGKPLWPSFSEKVSFLLLSFNNPSKWHKPILFHFILVTTGGTVTKLAEHVQYDVQWIIIFQDHIPFNRLIEGTERSNEKWVFCNQFSLCTNIFWYSLQLRRNLRILNWIENIE